MESLTLSVPSAAAADETVAWQDVRRVIDEGLATLPEKLRVPLVLCYLQERTRDEAAEQLGWSLTTLRGRLERGRERLRAELGRRGFPLSVGLVAVLLTESAAPAAPTGWAVEAARTAIHSPAITDSVISLAHGVVPAMNRWLIFTVSVVVAGGLAAGMIWVNASSLKPPPAPNVVPKLPAALLIPDPNAPPAGKELKGVWAGEIVIADGSIVRRLEIHFIDGKHLLWTVTLTKPGLQTSATIRCAYEIKNGELTLYILKKYAGEENLPLRPEDKNPRVYEFIWQGREKTGFRIKHKFDPDWPWKETTIKRSEEAPEMPDPLVPESLWKIDRSIKKEPKYADTPRYVLLTIGTEAKFKVWVVLDGTTLYVDRNGNGDLTDAGESIPILLLPGVEPNPRNPAFLVGELTDAAGRKHTDFHFGAIRLTTGSVVAKIAIRVDGKTHQTAGLTDLMLSDSPKDARVIHFDSRIVTVRPSVSMPSTADVNQEVDYRVQVGTPGIRDGSFASYGSEQLAEGVGPVAEFVFTPLNPKAEPKKLSLRLGDRCCGDQFYAKLTVPDGVKTGLNAATVSLSFPNCPWGKVEPATYQIDVIPKRK